MSSASATIPVGYKQTEVGVIPEDWETKQLIEITMMMTNGFVGTVKRHYTEDGNGVLYIQGYNVEENSFNFHGIKYVTKEFHKSQQKSHLIEGDLLTVQTGDVGLTTVVPSSLSGSNCHALIISRPKKKHVNSKFLSFYLNSQKIRAQLKKLEIGSTMMHLNVSDLLKFKVSLPPTLDEQDAIANTLFDCDELIQALGNLIRKKRDFKQGAMQELLTGKTRLPGFSGEWETATLGQIEKQGLVKLFRGNVISKNDINQTPGDYPIYSSSVISNGLFGCYGKFMFDEELITWSIDGGGHFFHRPKHRFSVTNVCGYMRILSSLLSCQFLAYCLQNLHSRKIFDYTMKAHPSVIRNEYSLSLPAIEEQEAIAEILSDMDAEIAALEQRLEKAKAIKQSMMQQLLTGRIRLVDPSTPVEASA